MNRNGSLESYLNESQLNFMHMHNDKGTQTIYKKSVDALVQVLCCCIHHLGKQCCHMQISAEICLPRPHRKKNWKVAKTFAPSPSPTHISSHEGSTLYLRGLLRSKIEGSRPEVGSKSSELLLCSDGEELGESASL